MADDAQARIIEENPIGSDLDAFLSSFNSICEARNLSCTSDALNRLTQEGKILAIVVTNFRLTLIQISKISHSISCLLCGTFLPLGSCHRKRVMELSRMISGD